MLSRFINSSKLFRSIFILGFCLTLMNACATKSGQDALSSLEEDLSSAGLTSEPTTKAEDKATAPSPAQGSTNLAATSLPKAKKRRHEAPEVSREVKSAYKSAIKSLSKGTKNKDFSEALKQFEALEKENPEISGPSTNIGMIYLQMEEYEKAEESFLKALTINNENEFAHYNLALTYRELGKFNEAKASYQEAIALVPDYADAHYNLGILAELYMDELELALQSYQYYLLASKSPEDQVKTWVVDLTNRVNQNNKLKAEQASQANTQQETQNSEQEPTDVSSDVVSDEVEGNTEAGDGE